MICDVAELCQLTYADEDTPLTPDIPTAHGRHFVRELRFF